MTLLQDIIMAENNKDFSPLDPLGPQFGSANTRATDAISLKPFEGDRQMRMPEINFPDVYQPKLTNQNQNIQRNIVGIPPNKPGANPNMPAKTTAELYGDYFKNLIKSQETKDSYSKVHAYNAGSSGNSFYKRYLAYGSEKFSKIGFNPVRNNEANFNAGTSGWDDFVRMTTHSFLPLFGRGFVSGPKSLARMLTGDFTGTDLEDAKAYEEAAAIGQSTKGGLGGFANNALMNFGYSAGIMVEAIAEEFAGLALSPFTGGTSGALTTANLFKNVGRAFKGLDTVLDGAKAVRQTLNKLNNVYDARKFWETSKRLASQGIDSKIGRFINPLENTVEAIQSIGKANNLSSLAAISKTAGGFYRDVRSLNMAISESRLEAGMVENKVYDKLYSNYVLQFGKAPSNEEEYEMTKQAKEASLETFYANAALIYGSNKITFNNITGPRGGLRNFIKNSTDDILEIAAKKGEKNFGKYGKVVYDRAAKAFTIEKNNIKDLAKSWYKNPGFKTASKTIGYFKSNFSEGFQENFQEIIARVNEKYYTESYQSPYVKSQLYAKSGIKDAIINRKRNIFGFEDHSDIYRDEFKKEFSSAQGFETFASGFVMGLPSSMLNNTIPFLSAQWNRTFDKPAYEAWKTAKAGVAEKLVQNLNDVSVKDFLSNKYYNAGSQDTLSLIKEAGSKKEGLDSELESYINQVDTMLGTNTSDLFIEQLESLKEMSDEEFADTIKLEGEEVKNVAKYRARLDGSIQKLKNVQKAFDDVNELLPNPFNLPDAEDIDKDEKEFLHMSWKMAQRNYVYFNESYKDALTRINGIQQSYLKSDTLKNLSNSDVSYMFDPIRLGDALNGIKTEIVSLMGLDPVVNKEKIKSLDKKYNALINFQNTYEEFNKVVSRAEYTADIKAKLVAEKIEPTPEAIQERMEQEYGKEDDETAKTKVITKLKKAHDEYLNTLASEKDGVIFKNDLDTAFTKLMDLYKLKQESKDIAKFANFIADPKGFYNTVLSNLKWMRTMYNSRNEYYTNLVNEQMNNAITNTLINKLADKRIYMSAEDLVELQTKGELPSEFYDDIKKLSINKGTSKYREIVDELITPYLEIIKENAKPVATEKNFNTTQKTFKEKMEAEIAKLPKEERIVDEKIYNTPAGEYYKVPEILNLIPNGYYGEAKGEFGSVLIYNDNGTYYQQVTDPEGEIERTPLTIQDYGAIEILEPKEFRTYKLEVTANPEEVEAIKKKYEERLKEEQEDFDASRPEVMQTAIEEILELVNRYDSVVNTKTNYFMDGVEHERMSNVIKRHVSLYEDNKAPKIQEFIDKTIGLKLTQENLNKFMTFLENEYGTGFGFTKDVYKAIREELESIIPVPETLPDGFRYVEEGEIIPAGDYTTTLSVDGKKSITNAPAKSVSTDAKKDDIERKSDESVKDFIQRLFLNNYFTEADSKQIFSLTQGRWGVIVNINGIKVPFYQSTSGTDTKVKAQWYPFFGDQGNWVIKGNSDDSNAGYGFKSIQDVQKFLNDNIKETDAIALSGIIDKSLNLDKENVRKMSESEIKSYGIKINSNLSISKEATAKRLADIVGYSLEEGRKTKSDSELFQLASKKIFAELKALEEQLTSQTETSEEPTNLKAQGSVSIKKNIAEVDKKISELNADLLTAKKPESIKKQIEVLLKKKQELQNELDISRDKILSGEELNNFVKNTVSENTYQINRDNGNYLDKQVKNFLNNEDAVFNPKIITKESFDNLFGPEGYFTKIRERVNNGDLWVYSKGLVVASKNLINDKNEKLKPVAGEIDLIFVDKEGNKFIVDLKTGDNKKWSYYRSNTPSFTYNTKVTNTLQQLGYANLVENSNGERYSISVLPVIIETDRTGKITSAMRPDITLDLEENPIGGEDGIIFNIALDPNILIPNTDKTVSELMQEIIPVNKPRPKTKTTQPTTQPTEKQRTDAEQKIYNEFIDLANTKGPAEALKSLESNAAQIPELNDFGALTQLYKDIEQVLKEMLKNETGVSKLPVVGIKYYNIFSQKQFIVTEINTTDNTVTFKPVGKGKFKTETRTFEDFNANFKTLDEMENTKPEPVYQPTETENENAKESKTAVDEFLNTSDKIKELDEKVDSITLKDAKDNLLKDLSC
jgi:hypothetical protein